MSINKKISEFISVDGFDNTTQIPIVQGNPMFNGKITPEKFAEALGLLSPDLDTKVDKVEGKSLILDTEIERLANVTNQTRASLNIDKVDNTSDLDKPISIATQEALDILYDLIWQLNDDLLDRSIYFVDPEVGRVLHANGLIANPVKSSKRELATITSLNPDGGTSTGYFYGNKVITEFPELQYCTGLTSLNYVFHGCTSLTEVILPSSVTSLYFTFSFCTSLTKAPIIPEGVTDLYGTFNQCFNLTTAPIIPSSVTSLNNTFRDCSSLTTVVIPEGVTSLNNTFNGCSNLSEAPDIPSSVVDMGNTFRGCTSLNGVYIINAVKPPYYANSLSNVKTICVPDESVDVYKVASGWSQFASKIYPMSEPPTEVPLEFADPEVGRVLHEKGLIASPTESSVEELATITSLKSCFKGNTVITQFPELQYCTGLTSSGLYETFRDCSNLTTVGDIIPEGVDNLGFTFRECSSLLKAPIIPSSVTGLLTTFYGCTSIDGIYVIKAATPTPYIDSLSNIQAIYVPDTSVSAYKSASGWIAFEDKIYPMSNKPQ